jgi:hypothetical protein
MTEWNPTMKHGQNPQGKKEPETLEEAAIDLVKTARGTMQLKSVKEFMKPEQPAGPDVSAQSALETNKAIMEVFKGLTDVLVNMNTMEREARIAAEKSNNDAQRQYFTLLADQAKDVQNRIQGMKPSGPQTFEEQIAQMEAWNDLVGRQAQGIAESVLSKVKMATSSTGLTSVDVELKKLELGQTATLEQLRQNHEVAMRQLDIELKKLELEMIRYQKGEANKQNWFETIMGGIGDAFQKGAGGQPLTSGAPPVAAQGAGKPLAARTAAGLIAVQCNTPGCGTTFAVVPGTEQIGCPTCRVVHNVADLEILTPESVAPPAPGPEE